MNKEKLVEVTFGCGLMCQSLLGTVQHFRRARKVTEVAEYVSIPLRYGTTKVTGIYFETRQLG